MQIEIMYIKLEKLNRR